LRGFFLLENISIVNSLEANQLVNYYTMLETSKGPTQDALLRL
jgi:hypothetical protein